MKNALGLIAYELVTGEFAFNLEKLSKFLPAKIKGDVVPPHLLNRKCSYELSAVIMRAIHVDPEERFDSVRSLEAAFRDPASCLVSDRVAKKLTEMPLVCDEAVAKRLRAERVQGAIESFNRFNPLMYALKFLVVGFGLAIKTARGTARWIFRIVADLVGITPGAIALGFTLFAIIGGLFLASPARYWFSPDNIWGEWRLKPSERQISTVKFISLRIGVNIDGTAKFYRNIRKEIQQMDFREKDNYSPSVKTAPGSQNYRIIAPTEPNSNQKARQQVEPFSKHDKGYRAISPKSK